MKPEPRATAPGAPPAGIEKAAADWVTRCDAGLTAAEQQIFQDWLAADSRHAEAFHQQSEAWAVFDRAQDQGVVTALLEKIEGKVRRRRSRRLGAAGVAAGLALVALILFFPARPDRASEASPGAPVVAAPVRTAPAPGNVPGRLAADAITVRRLPDGSMVELNEGAEIAVVYSAGFRRVSLLRGEAFFRVEKDPARPFLVEAFGVEVRAVGTAFAVHMQSAGVEVVVQEGAVDVSRSAASPSRVDEAPAVLPEGGAVRVDAGSRVVVMALRLVPAGRAATTSPPPASLPSPERLSSEDLDARLAWRATRVEFEGMALADAVELLNRHNALQIRLSDESIGRERISGTFRSDNPEGFVRIVEQSLDLVAERRGDREIVLRPAR